MKIKPEDVDNTITREVKGDEMHVVRVIVLVLHDIPMLIQSLVCPCTGLRACAQFALQAARAVLELTTDLVPC